MGSRKGDDAERIRGDYHMQTENMLIIFLQKPSPLKSHRCEPPLWIVDLTSSTFAFGAGRCREEQGFLVPSSGGAANHLSSKKHVKRTNNTGL